MGSEMCIRDRCTQVLKEQFDRMEEFVLPPHLDFTKTPGLKPIVMYIFPFEYELNRRDITDIWQGVMPESAMQVKNVGTSISHTLDCNPPHTGADYYLGGPDEVLVENPLAFHMASVGPDGKTGKNTFRDLRFMVFKAKQRAAINYFEQTLNTVDEGKYAKTFEVGGSSVVMGPMSKKIIDYSYNWPYDYCSLVEVAKLDMEIEMWEGEYVEDRGPAGTDDPVRTWEGKTIEDDTR